MSADRSAGIKKAGAWMRDHLWLVGVAACVLVLSRSIEFAPPGKVRVDAGDRAALVGDAPSQDFSSELGNPQALQLRASLRLFERADLDVASVDPEVDKQARLLSQPVVTTILGMSANVDQTIRLDQGDLEIDLHVEATPRILVRGKKGRAPSFSVEHRIDVTSRRQRSFGRAAIETTHLQSRGTLSGLEQGPYRVVFAVEDRLFALDLELHHQS